MDGGGDKYAHPESGHAAAAQRGGDAEPVGTDAAGGDGEKG